MFIDCTTKGMKYTHGQIWYETFPGEQRIENICKVNKKLRGENYAFLIH